jgi:hypothetical protein
MDSSMEENADCALDAAPAKEEKPQLPPWL